jgi:hypothetical protein
MNGRTSNIGILKKRAASILVMRADAARPLLKSSRTAG